MPADFIWDGAIALDVWRFMGMAEREEEVASSGLLRWLMRGRFKRSRLPAFETGNGPIMTLPSGAEVTRNIHKGTLLASVLDQRF
jgi:hypothetical protein